MRHLGHALASPSSEIGNENIFSKMELGLMEDDPPSRTAPAALERRAELFTHGAGGGRLR